MNTVKSTFFQIIKRKESLLFIVLIISGISFCGWLFDNIALASFSLKYKPISPIIAVTFIVLSILIYITLNFEKSRLTKSLVTLLFIIITIFYFIVVLGYLFNFAHGIENVFVKNADRYGSALTGYMSPIASLLIIFICISFLSNSQNNSYIIKNISGSFTLLVFLISSVLIVAYLYKAPLLFGSQVVPVSLPAVICFLVFSITLLRIYELKFLTHKLIKDNVVTRQLLKSFLPIAVFTVLFQGFLITNISIKPNSLTIFVAVILFIVVAVIIFIIIKVSENLGDKLMKAEQAINASEEKLKFYTNNSPMAVIEWDSDFIVTLWTGDSEKIFGWNAEEVVGKKIMDLNFVYEPDIPIVQKTMEKLTCGLFKQVISTNRNYRKDRSIITCAWYNTILQNQNGEMLSVLSQILNITERKQAEQVIKESEKKLLQLNTDKNRFISILGHDLKNPFNNLLGLSEVLTEDIHKLNTSEIVDIAHNIDKSVRIINNLLEDILMWAGTQQGKIPFKPQKLNFADICRDTLEILNPNAKAKNITISYSATEHINVFADIDMIKTVLRNLVSNAIKFTNKKGTININATQTDSNVTISVSDNGIGISSDNLVKLFDISEVLTTKGTAGETGTGLGLLLCKEFTEKHGGKIWVVSEVGKGSSFYFTIPDSC